ncbi:MAG TPA: bifunctional hydroxymethylpyrimidine kinase/phosphomethylpyrimidine kinase [Moorella mulderi]|nr:bifunctional hydroxymethylpyrimidine kinase/phosphomethylpyrimidine kinase [Moorella mulderi]
MKKALTIAGSDSGAGAGIQADLKTFAALQVYGTSVITSVTAQNTLGVQGIFNLPPSFVALQMDSVLSDIGADAVKTGMLANRDIIEEVAKKLREYKIKNLVIDPVMVAKSGDPLLEPQAVEALKEKLFPLALIITPNLEEAGALLSRAITSYEEAVEAARLLQREYSLPYVLVTGGHLPQEPVDILYDGRSIRTFTGSRHPSRFTHGAGCTFSAAITAFLARGLKVPEAVAEAKGYMDKAFLGAKEVGRGYGPLHHLAPYYSWGRDEDCPF